MTGLRIKTLRETRGWTLEQLSAATASEADMVAGIDPGNLSKIETGKTDPRLSTLMRLAAAFEVPLPSLLVGAKHHADRMVTVFELAATVAPYLAAAGMKTCSASWWIHVVEGGRKRPSFGRAKSEAQLAVAELGRAIDVLDAIEDAMNTSDIPPGDSAPPGDSPAAGSDTETPEGYFSVL